MDEEKMSSEAEKSIDIDMNTPADTPEEHTEQNAANDSVTDDNAVEASAETEIEEQAEAEPESTDQTKEMFSTMNQVAGQLAEFEKFIARRFDEISMEINATAQQIDMNEDEMHKRFGDIMTVLHAVSYNGDGSTAANAGVELGAVVEATESAANRILDAAERISDRIKASKSVDNPEVRDSVLQHISEDIEEIFLACSFQDITGQRIRNTLSNLREIEDRLGSALDQIGISVDTSAQAHTAITNDLSNQTDIDSLFDEPSGGDSGDSGSQNDSTAPAGGDASQDDIDNMF